MKSLEDMTLEKLREKVLPPINSIYYNAVFEEITKDVGAISSIYDRQDEFIIYCFYRLYKENLVSRYDYEKAYINNITKMNSYYEDYQKITGKK